MNKDDKLIFKYKLKTTVIGDLSHEIDRTIDKWLKKVFRECMTPIHFPKGKRTDIQFVDVWLFRNKVEELKLKIKEILEYKDEEIL